MENWPLFFVVVLGLVLIGVLVVSANISVKKLVGIAAYFNLSSTFMGMTVVSLANREGDFVLGNQSSQTNRNQWVSDIAAN